MAIRLECSECLHVQIIGLVPGGINGIANPHAVCESCGAVGSFHFFPGFQNQLEITASIFKPPDET